MKQKNYVLSLVLFFLLGTTAQAQNWSPVVNNTGFDKQVLSLYVDDATNILYAGGEFTTVDGITVNGIAKWDGTKWSAMGDGFSGGTANVYGITKYKNDIYAAGTFTKSGSTNVSGIARWDGTKWQPVGGGVQLSTQNDYVVALHEFNNELYVGGSFDTVGSTPIQANNVAKWDGTKWSAVADGADDDVLFFHTHNNELYMGGYFVFTQQIGVNVQYRIAKLQGNNFVTVGNKGLGDASTRWGIETITTYHGNLYAGGYFNVLESGSTFANHIAKWDGNLWSTVGNPAGVQTQSVNPVRSLIVYKDKLYAAGNFSSAGMANNTRGLAYWDDTAWHTVGQGTNGLISATAIYNDHLIIGGTFTSAGGQNIQYIAQYKEPVSVGNVAQEVAVTIAPNPFTQSTTISIGADVSLKNAEISIYDVSGRLINTYKNINHTIVIPRNNLPAGSYFYTLKNDQQLIKKGKLSIQ